MGWYRMPTGRDARQRAAAEDAAAHLDAALCVLSLLARVDPVYAARLLDALRTELRAAMQALQRWRSAD